MHFFHNLVYHRNIWYLLLDLNYLHKDRSLMVLNNLDWNLLVLYDYFNFRNL